MMVVVADRGALRERAQVTSIGSVGSSREPREEGTKPSPLPPPSAIIATGVAATIVDSGSISGRHSLLSGPTTRVFTFLCFVREGVGETTATRKQKHTQKRQRKRQRRVKDTVRRGTSPFWFKVKGLVDRNFAGIVLPRLGEFGWLGSETAGSLRLSASGH